MQGLPPGTASDIEWRNYGGLDVGLVGRRTLIALKLFATVDRGPRSVHAQDLEALKPIEQEIENAAQWVRTQDASENWNQQVDEAMEYVKRHRS